MKTETEPAVAAPHVGRASLRKRQSDENSDDDTPVRTHHSSRGNFGDIALLLMEEATLTNRCAQVISHFNIRSAHVTPERRAVLAEELEVLFFRYVSL
jgi:hypothetical protein